MRWSRAWTVPALVVKLTVMRVSYCGDLGMMQRKAQREEFLLPRKKKKNLLSKSLSSLLL